MAMEVLDALAQLQSQSEEAQSCLAEENKHSLSLKQEFAAALAEEDTIAQQTAALQQRHQSLLATCTTPTEAKVLERSSRAIDTAVSATIEVSRERTLDFVRHRSASFLAAGEAFRMSIRLELEEQRKMASELQKLRDEEARVSTCNAKLSSALAAANEKLAESNESMESSEARLVKSQEDLASLETRRAESNDAVHKLRGAVEGFKDSAEESQAFTKSYRAENVKLRYALNAARLKSFRRRPPEGANDGADEDSDDIEEIDDQPGYGAPSATSNGSGRRPWSTSASTSSAGSGTSSSAVRDSSAAQRRRDGNSGGGSRHRPIDTDRSASGAPSNPNGTLSAGIATATNHHRFSYGGGGSDGGGSNGGVGGFGGAHAAPKAGWVAPHRKSSGGGGSGGAPTTNNTRSLVYSSVEFQQQLLVSFNAQQPNKAGGGGGGDSFVSAGEVLTQREATLQTYRNPHKRGHTAVALSSAEYGSAQPPRTSSSSSWSSSSATTPLPSSQASSSPPSLSKGRYSQSSNNGDLTNDDDSDDDDILRFTPFRS